MKLKFRLLPLLLLAAATPAAHAQDAPSSTIKVTTSLNNDGTKTVVKTDGDNNTAENSVYDSHDKLIQKTVFKIGDNGSPVGGYVYATRGVDAKGQPKMVLVYMMVYKRDGLNRLSEVYNYSPTKQLLSRQVYRYDAGNKVIKVDNYDAAGNSIGSGASQAIPDRHR